MLCCLSAVSSHLDYIQITSVLGRSINKAKPVPWIVKHFHIHLSLFTNYIVVILQQIDHHLPTFQVVVTCAWWRHQMEIFSASLSLCTGNSPMTGEFPHKGQLRGALMFSLISAWINGWVNNREAGDLRRHRAHYDVIVMYIRHPNFMT